MSGKFEVGQEVSVRDRGRTYAGEIVRVGRVMVDIRYLGLVVRFWQNTQYALGTETGIPIRFMTTDDTDGQAPMKAARQVLASYGIELSSRHTLTVGQMEALANAMRTWQE
jgi:hypothetical protein